MKIVLWLAAAIIAITVLSAAYAVERTAFYDRSGNGNNVSVLSGNAFLNMSEVAKNGLTPLTFDGTGDMANVTPGAGAGSICNFNPTSNFTVGLHLYFPLSTAGNDEFLSLCHDLTGAGLGWGFKFIPNVNRIGIENGSTTVQGFNTSTMITYDQWHWVICDYTGNDTMHCFMNGTVAFNASVAGQLPNTTGQDRVALGAFNTGSQLFTGSIDEVFMYHRSLSLAEKMNISNGSAGGLMPLPSNNLTWHLNFRNTTTVNISVDQNNYSRPLRLEFWGFHVRPNILSSFGWIKSLGNSTLDTRVDYQENIRLLVESGAKSLRVPADLSNSIQVTTVVNSTHVTNTYRRDTSSGTINRHIGHWQELVNLSSYYNITLFVHFEDTALGVSNNSSPMCSYGTTDTLASSCMPSNHTLFAQIKATWLYDIGCYNYSKVVCYVGDRNEPYNPSGTNFWLANATGVQRSLELIKMYQLSGRTQMRYWATQYSHNLSLIGNYTGPSFADQGSSGDQLSEAMETNYTAAFPRWGADSPDWQETHIYTYDAGSSNLPTKYSQWQSRMTNGSYQCAWGITEGGVLDDNDNYNEQLLEQAVLAEADIYLLANTCAQFKHQFQLSNYEADPLTEENPSFMSKQFVNSTSPNGVRGNFTHASFKASKTLNQMPINGSIYECSSNSSSVTCLYARKNASEAYVYVANKQSYEIDVDTLSVSGFSITSVQRLTNGLANLVTTTETAAGGNADLAPLYPYGIAVYKLTGFSDNVSATQSTSSVSILEPANSTFTLTITNAANLSSNINWSVNGTQNTVNISSCFNSTTCNFTGNLSSEGAYTYKATMIGETNTSQFTWNLQVNDTYTVAVGTALINSTTNNSLAAIYFYANATSTNGSNVTFQYNIYKNGVLNTSYTTTETPGSTCVDYSANNTTTCSGRAGTVSVTEYDSADFSDRDGIITSYFARPFNAGTVYVQYKLGINGSDQASAANNSSISAACMAQSDTFVNLVATSFADVNSGYGSLAVCGGTLFSSTYSSFSTGTGTTNPDDFADAYDGNFTTSAVWYCGSTCQWYGYPTGTGSTRAANIYEHGLVYVYGQVVNSSKYLTEIAAGNLSKGQNWTLEVRVYDGVSLSSWSNSSVFTVGNVAPNASVVTVTNISGGVNCTYTYGDYDGDADASTFRWFRNGTVLSATSALLASGNYSLSDRIICEVTPYDSTANGTAVNSSEYILGDTTAPTVSSISVPTITTITDVTRISAVCTDDNSVASGYPVMSWRNPSGTIETNHSMTLLSGTTYYLDWVFLTSGYYTDFTVACRDGSGNTGSLSSTTTMAVSVASSGGGGGGGDTTVVQSPTGVEVIQPQSKEFNLACSANETIADWDIVLYNPTGAATTYSFKIEGATCDQIDPLTIGAKQTGRTTVTGCKCGGEGESIKGSVDIIDARSPGNIIASIPVNLNEDILSFFTSTKAVVFYFVFAGIMLFGAIIAAGKK